jgi:hypothetical protein
VGKWAENPQTLQPQGFQPAHFCKKPGQKPTFSGQKRPYKLNSSPKSIQSFQNIKKAHFRKIKSGRKFSQNRKERALV